MNVLQIKIDKIRFNNDLWLTDAGPLGGPGGNPQRAKRLATDGYSSLLLVSGERFAGAKVNVLTVWASTVGVLDR